ncbi:hypothetical protein HDU85_005782 [Gaertneriomyces sp. JEL0708]|nr:hypothetical protein HDU85_005782 [Gaertneriomyces sp. JEL0708]
MSDQFEDEFLPGVEQALSNEASKALSYTFAALGMAVELALFSYAIRESLLNRKMFSIVLALAQLSYALCFICFIGATSVMFDGQDGHDGYSIQYATGPWRDRYDRWSIAMNNFFILTITVYSVLFQKRFTVIKVVFKYPDWMTKALYAVTILMGVGCWIISVPLFTSYRPLASMCNGLFAGLCLFMCQALSGIFLFKLRQHRARLSHNATQTRRHLFVRNALRGTIIGSWIAFIFFIVYTFVLVAPEQQNLAMAVFRISLFMTTFEFVGAICFMHTVQALMQPERSSTSLVRDRSSHAKDSTRVESPQTTIPTISRTTRTTFTEGNQV